MIGIYEDYNKRRYKVLCKQMLNIGCPIHFHAEIELCYVLTNNHTAVINGNTFELTHDDMYFCNPMEPHQFSSKNNGTHILLTIKTNEFEAVSKTLSSIKLPNFLNDKEFNKTILTFLQEILNGQNNFNELEKTGYINIIIGKIINHYGAVSVKQSNNNFINILYYIENNYNQPLNRDSVAKHFGYTPNYFSALFKKMFHCGFIEYVNNIRYQHCLIDLTQNPNSNKYQVILDNGFNNIQTYYRIKKSQNSNYMKLKSYHNIEN